MTAWRKSRAGRSRARAGESGTDLPGREALLGLALGLALSLATSFACVGAVDRLVGAAPTYSREPAFADRSDASDTTLPLSVPDDGEEVYREDPPAAPVPWVPPCRGCGPTRHEMSEDDVRESGWTAGPEDEATDRTWYVVPAGI